jgi:hypothetical protein
LKKCASCTKDLPDAALHCVFCGAKQPPAPAVAGSVAKTVMGHASNEMIEQLKAQAAAAARNNAAPAPAPYTPPAPAYTPPVAQPAPRPAPQPAPVPSAGSVAPTMFIPGGGPPGMAPGSGPAPAAHPGSAPTMMAGPMGLPPGQAPGGMGMPPGPGMGMPPGPGMGMPPGPGMGMPPGPAPMLPASNPAPIPTASTPYTSRTTARAGRPIEPWKDSLRLMMFIWGGALLVAFMVPVTTEPSLGFWFNAIIDGEGADKLFPLLMAAVGLLSIVLAAIPTSPAPRGMIAALLGLCGILIPDLLMLSKGEFGLGQILHLVTVVGVLTLVPGLLLRSEYRDSIMPRIMVTIGALCVLAPYLIPQGGDSLPLIDQFKAVIDAPGAAKVKAIIGLGPFLLALLSLMAWLPAPGSGGAKVFAWLWITWGAVQLYTMLLVKGHIGDAVAGSPYLALVAWVAGVGGAVLGAAYLVLTGYGLATVLGKKLE